MNFHDQEPQLVEKKPSKIKEHLQRGMTAFLVIVAGVLFFFAMYRFSTILDAVKKVIGILSPVILGFVIAFLLNPIVKKTENLLKPLMKKVFKKEEISHKFSRAIGIFVALVVALLIVVALINMIIPEVYRSIRDLVVTLPKEIHLLSEKINTMLEGNSTLDKFFKTLILSSNDYIEEWISTDLLKWVQDDLISQTGNFVTSVTVGVVNVVKGIMNVLIGVIISVYLLISKEKFLRQSKKVIYALCKPKKANLILHIGRKANEIFNGFIIGKIIDSAIIGVLCFIGVSIFRMPYALLVSVIVGVTNVIPVFGPYMGAVPCAILILLVDPMKGLGFIIFIILLQQLDGNVIGPKILGESTGLSPFWVVFSILLAGGLFGIVGMIVGVPTFALIYYIIKLFIQQKLEAKNLPTGTSEYTDASHVNDQGVFVTRKENLEKEEKNADSSTE